MNCHTPDAYRMPENIQKFNKKLEFQEMSARIEICEHADRKLVHNILRLEEARSVGWMRRNEFIVLEKDSRGGQISQFVLDDFNIFLSIDEEEDSDKFDRTCMHYGNDSRKIGPVKISNSNR